MDTLQELIERGESCPYYRLLNIKIEEVKDGYARLGMTVEEKHLSVSRNCSWRSYRKSS